MPISPYRPHSTIPNPQSAMTPLVVAHRGASAYEVENSLAAFRAAVAMGADGVELDVHVTTDGVPVVHHDATVNGRTITHCAYGDLRGHRLANGEPLPTLAEVLNALGAEVDAFVEVKALAPEQDAQMLEVLERGPAPQRYHVHSFDHRIVRRLHDARPALPTGVLSASYPLEPFLQLDDAGATVLWQIQELVDADLVGRAHERGYRIFAWTVDVPERMRALSALGVDAVCTNRPDVARETLG